MKKDKKTNDFGFLSIEGGLIMWLRTKGLKMYSYVKKYAELKNQTLKKSAGT